MADAELTKEEQELLETHAPRCLIDAPGCECGYIISKQHLCFACDV